MVLPVVRHGVPRAAQARGGRAAGAAGQWLGCDYCDRWSHVACELAAAPREVDVGGGFDRIVGTADSFAEAFGPPPRETSGSTRTRPARGTAGSHADAEDGGGEEVGSEEFRKDGRKAVSGRRLGARGTRGIGAMSARAAASRGNPSGARELAAFASPTSVAAGARVAHGRVVRAPVPARRRRRRRGSRRSGTAPLGGGGGTSSGPGAGRGGRFPGGSVERARSFERTFDRSFGSEASSRPPPGPGRTRAVQARGRGDPLEGRPGGRVAPEPAALLARAEGSRDRRLRTERRETRNDFGDAPAFARVAARGRPSDETEPSATRPSAPRRGETRRRRHRRRGGFRGFGGGPEPFGASRSFRSLPKPLHREPGGTPIAAPAM